MFKIEVHSKKKLIVVTNTETNQQEFISITGAQLQQFLDIGANDVAKVATQTKMEIITPKA